MSLAHPLLRPRLRSTSGCLTCRKRRKKCNEHKPSCGDCSRHGLRCIWPTDTTSNASKKSPSSSSISDSSLESLEFPYSTSPSLSETWWPSTVPLLRSPTDRLVGLKSEREQSLFFHFTTKFIPLLLRPDAHPGYSDSSNLYSMTLSHPWLMFTFLGLAALHRSQEDPQLHSVAMDYYYAAVSAVRKKIGRGDMDVTEDWLLVATIFFYIFEEWNTDVLCKVMYHLEGTAELFKLRRAKGIMPGSSSHSPLYRIAAESFLYHVATMSLFHEDIDRLSNKFSWADLDGELRLDPYPDSSSYANSPILGSCQIHYRLCFDITRLSRRMPLHGADHIEAENLKKELEILHKSLYWDDDDLISSNKRGNEDAARLYILALQIFLFKLLNPEASAAHPQVRWLTRKSVLLARNSAGEPSDIVLCWPMIIVACAVESAADKALLKEKLSEVWKATSCGYVQRATIIIESVWQRKWSPTGEGGAVGRGVLDGLDLLIQPKGLLNNLYIV